jgi:heme A synthase
MATVQEIYDMAIHLMDEQNEDSGETTTQDTAEYKFRTISILNTVIPALAPYSGEWTGKNDVAILYPGSYANPNMDQFIPLDDTLSYALLPFYLAGMLLSSENEELSAMFMNRYTNAFFDLRSKQAAVFEPITPAYGLF